MFNSSMIRLFQVILLLCLVSTLHSQIHFEFAFLLDRNTIYGEQSGVVGDYGWSLGASATLALATLCQIHFPKLDSDG